MPVNLPLPQAADLHPVPGVRIGVVEAGVRKAHRKDLTVVLLDEGRVAATGTHDHLLATNERYRAVLAALAEDDPTGEIEVKA